MDVTLHIRSRMAAEREAAIALERAIKAVAGNSLHTVEDIKSGIERASWYSSCFFDKYINECNQLKSEDKRFLKALAELYKHPNIVTEMMEMFIDEEINKSNITKIQELDMQLTKFLAGYYSGRATKAAIASSLSTLIINSPGFSNSVFNQINRRSMIVVTAASFYGKVQYAAQQARRLQLLYPSLYMAYYNKGIEMLYFIFSEKVDYALRYSAGLNGEKRFIHIIQNLAH